jgi:hypothetical protein
MESKATIKPDSLIFFSQEVLNTAKQLLALPMH